ncbi:glycosyltransferase family 4 protein [Mucilaginibacter rubeus]|uniref:Glycosyltransferase family 4 protein n=1 Tax=Mucilaginibacter rubeus TaxID=2027860 RepID=A0A5C1HZ12_9SPHI|nr:glycosyltransferase family 4 protein [Mucilaginibacter rubeus]QEM10955.1 glycosyltransferase family 4 protein [Mucilaginibacter rubeus]
MNIPAAPLSKPVLFFIIPSLKGGGAERVIISLANYFNKNNFQSVLISLNNDIPAYEIDNDVKVYYLTDRQKSRFVDRVYHITETFYKLIKLSRTLKPVCTLSFITSANIWSGITCSLTRVPYIVSERTSPDRSVNSFTYWHKHLALFLYKRAAAVVVSAKGVEDCLLKDKDFKSLSNIDRITNAVTIFQPASDEKVHNRRFILGVGRLAYVKGFDILIDAYAKTGLEDIDLIVVGDGEERATLVEQIAKLGLKDRVLLPGSRNNLQNYYSQAEIYVLPSRNEGYPNALVEAMSFGCPSVAFDCNFGPAEIIANNENGILVNNGSVKGLSDAIARLASDQVLRDELGSKARIISQTNHPDKILGEWEALIKKHAATSAITAQIASSQPAL